MRKIEKFIEELENGEEEALLIVSEEIEIVKKSRLRTVS